MTKYYSQWKQDFYMNEEIFKNKQNGFFVDIGAYDGIAFSNSYYFEKNLNWKGICIEPHPIVFEKLKQNRSCFLENVAISNVNKQLKFLKIDNGPEMLSGLVDNYDQRHIERIGRETILDGGTIDIIDVNCVKLDYLLDKYNVDQVDYLSIDVEGAELDILKGIDFNKYLIKYITIEDNYPDASQEWHKLLHSNNFEPIQILGHDYVYKNKSIDTF
jgi:FkbM family methyltransferase